LKQNCAIHLPVADSCTNNLYGVSEATAIPFLLFITHVAPNPEDRSPSFFGDRSAVYDRPESKI